LVFKPQAIEDLAWWIKQDRKTALKIIDLLEDCLKHPFEGRGKPEPLKHQKGYWSRRITKEHRLIYKVSKEKITVYACRSHYETLKP